MPSLSCAQNTATTKGTAKLAAMINRCKTARLFIGGAMQWLYPNGKGAIHQTHAIRNRTDGVCYNPPLF